MLTEAHKEEERERTVGARAGQMQNAGGVKRDDHGHGAMCRARASDPAFFFFLDPASRSPEGASECKVSILRKLTLSVWRLDKGSYRQCVGML